MSIIGRHLTNSHDVASRALQTIANVSGKVVSYLSDKLTSAVDGLKKLPTMFRSEDRALAASDSRSNTEAEVKKSVFSRLGASVSSAASAVSSLFSRDSTSSSGSQGTSRADQNRAKEYMNVDARIAKFKAVFPDCDAERVEQVVTKVTEGVVSRVKNRSAAAKDSGLSESNAETLDSVVRYMLVGEGSAFKPEVLENPFAKFAVTGIPVESFALKAIKLENDFQQLDPSERVSAIRTQFKDEAKAAPDAGSFMRGNPKKDDPLALAYYTIKEVKKEYYSTAVAEAVKSAPKFRITPENQYGGWDEFPFETDAVVNALRPALDPERVPDDLCKYLAAADQGTRDGVEGKPDADQMIENGRKNLLFLRTLSPAFTAAGTFENETEKNNCAYFSKLIVCAANNEPLPNLAEREATKEAIGQIKTLVDDYKAAVLKRGYELLAADAAAATSSQTPVAVF